MGWELIREEGIETWTTSDLDRDSTAIDVQLSCTVLQSNYSLHLNWGTLLDSFRNSIKISVISLIFNKSLLQRTFGCKIITVQFNEIYKRLFEQN